MIFRYHLEVFLVRQCEIFLDILSLHPANAIAAAVAIAPKLGKLTLVDWVQADETTVNRRAMEALEHCRCYWYCPGVGSNYSPRSVEKTRRLVCSV
jgi:hypothetical protein